MQRLHESIGVSVCHVHFGEFSPVMCLVKLINDFMAICIRLAVNK